AYNSGGVDSRKGVGIRPRNGEDGLNLQKNACFINLLFFGALVPGSLSRWSKMSLGRLF
ncbi:hypothetical protein SCG7086_DK_00010, partial [Chlamydiales bacterium SCGC AG-110-P3]